MQFPGYYTMDFLENGNVAGMLSVNGYTGQVWHHTWHDSFISEAGVLTRTAAHAARGRQHLMGMLPATCCAITDPCACYPAPL